MKKSSKAVKVFLDDLESALRENVELVVSRDKASKTISVHHRGDPNNEHGKSISVIDDKWVHFAWEGMGGEMWKDYDVTNPNITVDKAVEDFGDCLHGIPKCDTGFGKVLVGSQNEYGLVEYSKEDYEEYKKKATKAMEATGVRKPIKKLPKLYKNVLLKELGPEYHKTASVFYYINYIRPFENKWMFLCGNNRRVDNFKDCDCFASPENAVGVIKAYPWDCNEWTRNINPEKHVRIFSVYVYRKASIKTLVKRFLGYVKGLLRKAC